MMTFEQWQRRPVYVVQCFTASVYRSLGGRILGLRLKRQYRKPQEQIMRNATAVHVREMRRDGLDRREVMRRHESILANPRGLAVRVDFDEELARRLHGDAGKPTSVEATEVWATGNTREAQK